MVHVPLVLLQETPAEALGWVDITALAVLLVFCVLGLFRGFVWQLSRIVTILLGIHLSGTYAPVLEPKLVGVFGNDAVAAGMPFYAAYFAIFLVVLIVLSLLTILVEKLVKKTGLSFYDRLGGAMLGLGTGAASVLCLLILVFALFPDQGSVVSAAERSRSLEFSRKALQATRPLLPLRWIPEGVRARFGLSTDIEKLQQDWRARDERNRLEREQQQRAATQPATGETRR